MNSSRFLNKARGLLAISISCLTITSAFAQRATVSEQKLMFKTYPFSDPDPVPLVGPIYPYFRFHGYSRVGRDEQWTMISLENSYVKALVAPEIGGKVWGALEKSTGRPFIYWNKVVKFREIALRGPWTSGGIEFNFGIIGHAPTTATPVDYAYKENDDGSVSCIVGAIDLPSRTVWRVNIRVPKEAAYLETECFWYNPQPLHDSLYHWMTAAEDVGEDLKYYYPGIYYIGHGGEVSSWPLAAGGRDVSYYRNNDFGGSKSYHILGERNEYFGGYRENEGFGYGHWALYDDKPGMKLWIWSLARDGEIWRDLLTDPGNTQYTEPQTGLLYNQAGGDSGLTPFKHCFFAPQSVMHWKEIWFPIKDIGGLAAASPHAALNVTRDGKLLRVGLCPLQKTDDDLVVEVAGEVVFSRHLELRPMETFIQEVELGEKKGEIVVALGKEKLRWSSRDKEKNLLGRPVVAPENYDWNSAEGLFVAGEELAKQRDYAKALAKFSACLEKEPGHVRALTRVAEIYFRRAEYLKALDRARNALAIDAYDAPANFIYGAISRRLDNFADARDGFGWAARSQEFRSAAYEELAELDFLEKRFERAAEYASRALDYNTFNLNARELQAVLFRLAKDRGAADRILSEIEEIDPLNHFVRGERYLLDPSPAAAEAFTSLIRNELPQETYLELSLRYFHLGREEDAARVLELAPSHPMVHYWLAYLHRDQGGEMSRQYLARAVEARPHLVFPFRTETLPVLRWAAGKEENWKTTYYIASILWNVGRVEEAKDLFGRLTDRPDWGPFYLARARLFEGEGNGEKVLADIQRALRLDKGDWRAWRAQTAFYEKSGKLDLAPVSAKTAYRQSPDKDALAMDYAKALLHAGQYGECLKILEKTTVLPYEGAWEGRDLYRQAYLFSAVQALAKRQVKEALSYAEKAKLWPESLGVGKPYDVDERLEDFLLATAAEKTGQRDLAQTRYEAVAAATSKFRTSWDSADILSLLALRKLGREEEAARLLDEWGAKRGQDDAVFAWASAKYRGDEARAEAVLANLRSTPAGSSWDMGTGDRYFQLVQVLTRELSRIR